MSALADLVRKDAETQEAANAAARQGMSSYTQGVCMSVDWVNSLVVANIKGAEVSVPMVGSAPFPADRVLIGYLGALPVCLGPIPKSSTGTVTADPVGSLVAVTTDDSQARVLPFVQGYTPALGHRVIVDWPANGVVIGQISADPAGVIPVVPPSAGVAPSGGSGVFLPTDSATWRGGWVDNLFGVSESRRGFYWYGFQIRDTIPNTATINSFGMTVQEDWNRLSSVTLTLHSDSSRTGAPPNPLDTFNVSGGSGLKPLPLPWAAALRDGTAFGIGSVEDSGYLQWQSSATSGGLSISWS
ncbi:hypothetical protein A4X17_11250 [Plantibacter sp. H53]|uniref:hypothetical protein n=1 Tax=Plantibacter sp. H53 TaxID=1827323 RepID=UPI0007DA00CE|nr:hypothetical protein [Plantibacter sp. H53]OAN35052.1 hypothetical protein A4X17_11250 [Plantibacter sp. H53]